jgi:hypothetical protein
MDDDWTSQSAVGDSRAGGILMAAAPMDADDLGLGDGQPSCGSLDIAAAGFA